MLISLSVKNFAIIDNMQIDFHDAMTVLTGETGAGKSLIIDAIGLLFGKRASSEFIRFGENKATIEGVFDSPRKEIFDLLGEEIDPDETLIIKREIFANGKSLCKINNNAVTLAQLSEISELIGDIHTQIDTQGLFNPKNYLKFIDDDGIDGNLTAYRILLKAYREADRRLQNLLKKNQEDTQRLEFLKYQAKELEKANLSVSEEEDLKQQANYLANFENISQNVHSFLDIFNENKVLDNIYSALAMLGKLEKYDEKYKLLKKNIEDEYYNLSDNVSEVAGMFKKFEFDPQELEQINERLGLYSDLKRKYKKTVAEIVSYRESVSKELSQIENYDEFLKEAQDDAKAKYEAALKSAQCISERRKVLAQELRTQILSNLSDLQLKNTKLDIVFADTTVPVFNSDGIDSLDFMITFNPGEPLRPLSKVASGGELSRFMLALKTIVAGKMKLQTIIFDEIDNGVSGAIAFSIASKIKNISRDSQVLCVTHLPQVAAVADYHFRISKATEAGRTITRLEQLDHENRITEIAKMISNGEVTVASQNLAAELLKTTK
jgi:DNA repair protein RecN (Recombination protein N)